MRRPPTNSGAHRVRGGPGVYVRSTPNGFTVSFDAGAALWLHPFKVGLSGDSATIRPGFVNGLPATIGGVPLEGTDELRPPRLEWDDLLLDGRGRGYIALELTFSKEDWSIESVEVVQVAYLHSDDGTQAPARSGGSPDFGGTPTLPGRRCRHALAMIRERASGRRALFQITHFNLQHRVDVRNLGDGSSADFGRHFFWPT